jgi:Domain of unknown function (DUF4249)
MGKNIYFQKVKVKCLLIFTLMSGCLERINFDVPQAQLQLVVEGMISDEEGPYTVKISTGMSIDSDSIVRIPFQDAIVKLYDDIGTVENLMESNPGIYVTAGIIQGQVGHSYHIAIETPDGNFFESEPDMIKPVGRMDSIRFKFEARTVREPFGEVQADVFNIYVDAQAGSGEENFVRWRFKGTYMVTTYPELHEIWEPPYTPYKAPLPCSGYVLVGGPIGSGGLLEKRSDCICCTCWVNHLESIPQLSDTQLIYGNEFKNVKVGEVPITNNTMSDKYMVEVEQMSLTRKSFDFFKLIRAQKEGAASIFQPPSGEIIGNLKQVNNTEPIIGLFWATSIDYKKIFIHRGDVPYPVTPSDFIANDCRRYPNSTNVKPNSWE